MSIHRKIRELIEGNQKPSALVQLRPDLLTAVEEIAAQNGRTVGEVANELIGHALYDHQLTESSLQIWGRLTQREITALIWLRLSNPQIAQNLIISENTVKTHIKNILSKFNVHSKKSLSELLAGLDLSDWIDSGGGQGADDSIPPTPADLSDGANPY